MLAEVTVLRLATLMITRPLQLPKFIRKARGIRKSGIAYKEPILHWGLHVLTNSLQKDHHLGIVDDRHLE